ncbi:MAG TPA: STAS/SEC14 domain-containing protein [Chthoniobacterales bacterium]|nr:STAS/SEC14 domain-containing protein [Chthoniobacterales bacterium]
MITIQPETQGKVLVAKASNKLTAEDYETILIPKLQELMAEYEKIRLVIEIDPSFEGWEPSALWDGASFGLGHRKHLERVAIVGAPSWLKTASNFMSHFLPAELKHYDASALQEALAWVRE